MMGGVSLQITLSRGRHTPSPARTDRKRVDKEGTWDCHFFEDGQRSLCCGQKRIFMRLDVKSVSQVHDQSPGRAGA